MIPITRTIARALAFCAASVVLASALAEPATAGHGAVSYENPTKAAERKKREKQAELGQPATAPVSAAPVADAAAPSADRNHAFAATARRQLLDVARIAEDQVANGTDPQLEAVARKIQETLRREIAELDEWLAAHPQPASAE